MRELHFISVPKTEARADAGVVVAGIALSPTD